MLYALSGGSLSLATVSGQGGVCPGCGSPVVAKCGAVISNHWAHKRGGDCVTGSEPMTEWHRRWQSLAPPGSTEVWGIDERNGKRFRADIKLPSGLVVEVQHSHIPFDLIREREEFWSSNSQGMLWIRNGSGLSLSLVANPPTGCEEALQTRELRDFVASSFLDEVDRVLSALRDTDPRSAIARDLREKARGLLRRTSGFWRHDSDPFFEKVPFFDGLVGEVSLRWRRSRPTWGAHKVPVLIDMPGEDFLVFLNPRVRGSSRHVAIRGSYVSSLISNGELSLEHLCLQPLWVSLEVEERANELLLDILPTVQSSIDRAESLREEARRKRAEERAFKESLQKEREESLRRASLPPPSN